MYNRPVQVDMAGLLGKQALDPPGVSCSEQRRAEKERPGAGEEEEVDGREDEPEKRVVYRYLGFV